MKGGHKGEVTRRGKNTARRYIKITEKVLDELTQRTYRSKEEEACIPETVNRSRNSTGGGLEQLVV